MSQENVEAFKRATKAANRRDFEAMLEEFDPEVEWHPGMAALLGGETTVYRGHEGIRELVRDLDESFANFHAEYSDIRDLGDRLVAIGRLRTVGKASGAVTESPFCYVGEFRNGKVIGVRTFLNPTEALEAAGLSEQAMSQENVEIVRGHIEAFRRGDPPGALSHLDSYVVWDASRVDLLDVTVAYGHEEFSQTIRHYIGAFEDYDYEARRLIDLGSGAVLAVLTEEGRGKSSGVPVRRSFAALYTVIDGKIARVTFFPNEAQALEAAGLREQAMSQENVEIVRRIQ